MLKGQEFICGSLVPEWTQQLSAWVVTRSFAYFPNINISAPMTHWFPGGVVKSVGQAVRRTFLACGLLVTMSWRAIAHVVLTPSDVWNMQIVVTISRQHSSDDIVAPLMLNEQIPHLKISHNWVLVHTMEPLPVPLIGCVNYIWVSWRFLSTLIQIVFGFSRLLYVSGCYWTTLC